MCVWVLVYSSVHAHPYKMYILWEHKQLTQSPPHAIPREVPSITNIRFSSIPFHSPSSSFPAFRPPPISLSRPLAARTLPRDQNVSTRHSGIIISGHGWSMNTTITSKFYVSVPSRVLRHEGRRTGSGGGGVVVCGGRGDGGMACTRPWS